MNEEQNIREHQELKDAIKDIKDMLIPMSETYKTVSKLGKWGMALLVLIAMTIGLLSQLKNLLHK